MRHLFIVSATANALSIGIDLGTSTSCCAVYCNGAPEFRAKTRRRQAPHAVGLRRLLRLYKTRHSRRDTERNEALVTSQRAIGLDKETGGMARQEPDEKRLRLDDG